MIVLWYFAENTYKYMHSLEKGSLRNFQRSTYKIQIQYVLSLKYLRTYIRSPSFTISLPRHGFSGSQGK